MMLSIARETLGEFGVLWSTVGKTLRASGAMLLLLFTLGWVVFFLTVLLAGIFGIRISWVIIPLMGAGCMIQLLITIWAYKRAIEQAETTLKAPQLNNLSFRVLVTTLLIAFIAAYSVFGFFEDYAYETYFAATSLGDWYNLGSILDRVNPLKTPLTTVVCCVVFLVLWVLVRWLKSINEKRNSVTLTVLTAFLSSTQVFLGFFSISRLIAVATDWLDGRAISGWWEDFLYWLGDLINKGLPQIVERIWTVLKQDIWPVAWEAISQPILWLVVVALVGGMQFLDTRTIWESLSNKLETRRVSNISPGVRNAILDALQDPVETVLCFFHLIVVVLRSGVPFLSCLIISFAVIQQSGAWLDYLVARLIGSGTEKTVLLLHPLTSIFSRIIVPGCQAVLLATAFIRLRQRDAHLSVTGPIVMPWKSVLSMVLAIAVASGIFLAKPGDFETTVPLSIGTPATITNSTVTINDFRVGKSLVGNDAADKEPLPTEGVFVVVNVTIASKSQVTMVFGADIGSKLPVSSWTSTVATRAGFSSTTDLVFEIPRDSLDTLTIFVQRHYATVVSSITTVGVLSTPSSVTIQDEVYADSTLVEEVNR